MLFPRQFFCFLTCLLSIVAPSSPREQSGRQAEYAKIEPGLEKYSVEWLQLEQTRFKKPAPVDPAPPLIAAAFGLASLALFLGH